MKKSLFVPVVSLHLLLSFSLQAFGGDEPEIPKLRKPFLEALNALELTHQHGFLHEIPVLEAIAFIGKNAGIEIAVSKEAARFLQGKAGQGKAVLALRNRLRFARESVRWERVHVRQILNDFARRYAFALEFDSRAFEGAEGLIPSSAYGETLKRLHAKPVELNLPGVTLQEATARIRELCGLKVLVDGSVPTALREGKVHVLTGKLFLEAALRRIAHLYDVYLKFDRGNLIFTARDPGPLPWTDTRGFWVTFSGDVSAEFALSVALTSCKPRLALRFANGRWGVGQYPSRSALPWEKEIPGHVNIDFNGETALGALQIILGSHDLGVYFPEGKPTVLAVDAPEAVIPRTERTYTVSFLKGSHEDFPGNFPRPWKNANQGAPPMYEESVAERFTAREMRESVIDFVRSTLFEKGFGGSEAYHAELSGGRLKIQATPDVQEKTANLLNELRSYQKRAVRVSFHFMQLDGKLMKTLIGLGSLSWGALSADQLRLLQEGLENKKAKSVRRANIIAFNGQTVNASAVSQKTYVTDYDVEVAQAAQIGDPIISSIREGMVAEVTPVLFGDGEWILLNLQSAVTKVLEPVEKFETPHGVISLPNTDFQRIGTSLFVKNGGSVIVGGTGNLGVGKNLVLCMTVKAVRHEEKDLFGATRFHDNRIRVFDIRDLTYSVLQRLGPKVGITSSSEDAMPPMMDEGDDDSRIGERYDPDEIIDLIRERIDPDSWDAQQNGISLLFGHLVVMNSRANLAHVAGLLEKCRERRVRGVEIVTRFLSLDSEELASILEVDSDEQEGASLTAEQLNKILALADRDENARLSASTFVLLNKQRASMQMGRSIHYVRDVDVEVAQFVETPDPITGNLLEGVFLDYRVELDSREKEVTIELRPTIAKLKKMEILDIEATRKRTDDEEKEDKDRKDKTGVRKVIIPLGRIMLPQLELQKIRTTMTLKDGATALVYCPAEAAKETNRDLVILISVRTAGPGK